MRAWASPRLLFALLLSLLLHLAATLGEPLLLWLESDGMDETPLIQPAKRKLLGQALDTEPEGPGRLAGVTPADHLTVRLGRPASAGGSRPAQASHPTIKPTAAPQPKPGATPDVSALTQAAAAATPPKPDPKQQAGELPASADSSKPAAPTVEPAAPVQPPSAVTTATAAEPAPSTSRPAKVTVDNSFPRSIDISYIVKGLVLAEHRWRLEGKQYRIRTQGSLFGKAFDMQTEGEVSSSGLRPHRFVEYRDQKLQPKYEVDFNWDAHKVLAGEPGQQKEFALEEGAQDLFSAAYQFALQGNRLPTFNMQVVTGRNSYQVGFELKGEAELVLSGQKVNTLVLAGAHDKRRFEFYLAPDWHNLPVRIRYQDGEQTIDLVAVQVALDGKTTLKRAERVNRDR
ncbi:DUF3108 domain-containing protein [Chitinimonas sp.]|uniref:DUF3108 domain-containing protein n=1 Tax=Chitinimonas sp. TaxID=1934313 RepID=UPI002F94074A